MGERLSPGLWTDYSFALFDEDEQLRERVDEKEKSE
jgi:hypothetical protein